MHNALTLVVVGLVGFALAFGLLSLAHVLQPGSRVIERDLVPRPILWLIGWARARTFRLWSDDPSERDALRAIGTGPHGRRISRMGIITDVERHHADSVVAASDSQDNPDAIPVVRLVLAEPITVEGLEHAVAHAARRVRTTPPVGHDVVVQPDADWRH